MEKILDVKEFKELHFKPLLEVAALLQNRDISSVELTQSLLKRIESLDGRQKSYATVMPDQAPGGSGAGRSGAGGEEVPGAFTWDPYRGERSVFHQGDPNDGGSGGTGRSYSQ